MESDSPVQPLEPDTQDHDLSCQESLDSVSCIDGPGTSYASRVDLGHEAVKRSATSLNENESGGVKKPKVESSKLKVMTNELILAKVAEGLPAKEILDLRQVCTLWNHNFVPELRKKHDMVSLSDSELDAEYTGVVNFVELARSSLYIPFSSFYFSLLEEGQEDRERESLLQDFIPMMRNNITYLSVHVGPNALPGSDAEFRRIIFDMTPQLTGLCLSLYEEQKLTGTTEEELTVRVLTKLPKLKNLELDVELSSVVPPAFTQLVYDIIQCATELESLNFNVKYTSNDVRNITLGGALQNAITHFSNLKTLQLYFLKFADFQILNQLARKDFNNGLKLESLLITFNYNFEALTSETVRLFQEFLSTQTATLKKLYLNVHDSGVDVNSQRPIYLLPRMEHLKQLSLRFSGFLPSRMQFQGPLGSRTFVETFPQLKQFIYDNDRHSRAPRNSEDLNRYFHSEVVYLKIHEAAQDYASFRKFGPVLTSLRRLELYLSGTDTKDIHVDVKEFGKIWTTWPNLSAISIIWQGDSLDLDIDSWLSGVSRPELENLRHEINAEKVDLSKLTLDALRAKLDNFKTRSGISSLTQLKEFKIIAQGENKPKLTNMGGYFGLALASPSLQRAIIHGNGENLVSEDCIAYIGKVFGVCSVISL